MFEPYVAVKQSCILGESPIWCAAEQALYWVDIRNPMIYRWDPVSGDMQNWRIQTEIGSIGFAGPGRFIAGTRMGFAYISLADAEFEELEDPEGDGRMNAVRMNDGKVDRQGQVLVRFHGRPGLWRGCVAVPVRSGPLGSPNGRPGLYLERHLLEPR